MAAMLRRRLFESALSLVCLICMVFVVARLTGDPGALYLPLKARYGMSAEFNHIHGFDQPIGRQFLDFVEGIARLDFGMSLRRDASALDMALEAYPATLKLAGVTITLA